MRRFLKYLRIGLTSTVIALIILAAVAIGVVRLLLPFAGHYRADIEQRVSETLGQPVKIGAVDVEWQGLNPRMRLSDVRLVSDTGDRTLYRFGEMVVEVDLPYYLRHGRVKPGGLRVSKVMLSLVRRSDGSLLLEGMNGEATGSGGVLGWFVQQGHLRVDDSELYWTDQRTQGKRLHFTGVNLILSSQGARHQLSGKLTLGGENGMALPKKPDQHLDFVLDFNGAITQPAEWAGKFYLRGQAMDLAQWSESVSSATIRFSEGTGGFQVWGEWTRGHLGRLDGEFSFDDVSWAAAPVKLTRASGLFSWQRDATGWALGVERLVIRRGNTPSPASRLTVLATTQAGATTDLDIRADTLRLEEVNAIVLAGGVLPPALQEALKSLQPQGELRDLRVRLPIVTDGARFEDAPFSVQTQVVDLVTQAWNNVPEISGLDAMLRGDQHSGTLDLDTHHASFIADKLLQASIGLDTLSGQVSWQHTDGAWRIGTENLRLNNADLDARLNMHMEFSEDGSSPFLDARVALENFDVGQLSRYLPVKVMAPKATHWLEQSFPSGRITGGSALFYGRLSDFPFDAHQGNFEVSLTTRDLLLAYHPEWPWLGDTEAEVVFRGRSMEVNAASARIYDSELIEGHAEIADVTVHEPLLIVKAKAKGPTSDVVRLLNESPLKKEFGPYVSQLSAEGQSVLNLDLEIPLFPTPNRVKGTLELKDSSVRLPKEQFGQAIEFTHITGTVEFMEGLNFTGNDLAATFNGQPGRLTLRTEQGTRQAGAQGPAPLTGIIELRSRADIATLVKQLKLAAPDIKAEWFNGLEGETDWLATLRLSDTASGAVQADLALASSLQGVTVRLPAPLAKAANEELPVRITTDLVKRGDKRLTLHYGDRINGILELSQQNGWGLKRGELSFGGGEANLPEQGLRLSGELPQLSWADWQAYIATSAAGSQPNPLLQLLNRIDVRFGVLEVFDQRFNAIALRAEQDAQGWGIALDSEAIAGRGRFLQTPEQNLTMTFERLHLAALSKESKPSDLDPRHWPALHLISQSFKYGDIDLGRTTLDASKQTDGLRIDRLQLESGHLRFDAKGDWLVTGAGQTSHIDGKLDTDDLGKALAQLGYAETVAGGKAQMEIAANWPGGPGDYALAHLNGTLSLKASKGRFLDIEPGAGRLFGLLSLQALPRRLTLDFSDLFAKGFGFDKLSGNFSLQQGNAYTNNFIMEGPSAVVAVTGRTGLDAKDYDQVVTVVPQIGSTLPLAAAVAGGPIAALSAFLAGKLLPGISEIARYQYTVKGPWEKPIIEPVSKPTDTKP
jgi:uncharacterized protein (TIGR02099 family)